MQTEIVNIADSGIDTAINAALAVFANGGVVAAPTDTVYGLICPADNAVCVREIYNVKGRDGDKPLIHLAISMEQVSALVPQMSGFELATAERYWRRGLPLTIVFENGVSVRMVYGGFAYKLIQRLNKAAVAPSANTQGADTPHTAAAVLHDLGGKIPLIIDGGVCTAQASTIIKIEHGKVMVLRQGDTIIEPEAEPAFILGLTGGSGAGKTRACGVFAEYGFAVINCDAVVHEVLDTSECAAEVAELLGGGVTIDGRLDRAAIASVIFADEAVKTQYLAIIFPRVTAAITGRIDVLRKHNPLILLDAPTLYESGLDRVCDSVIAVVCDADVAVKRITARDGITQSAARTRLASGKPAAYYADRCEHVIRNNGTAAEFERAIHDCATTVANTIKEKAIGKLP